MTTESYNDLFVPVYKRQGPPMVRGKGAYLYDGTGKKYLDFGSGIAVNALGHGHPALLKAINTQSAKALHFSNLYFSAPQIDLAAFLVKHSFGDRVFFCNSGTEAMEGAIKFARKWAMGISKKKYNILSFTDSFHGRTYGAMSATAQTRFHTGFYPILDGFYYAPFNDIEKTKAMLDKREYAAVIVEPLQGEGGINEADEKFLHFLRSYTRKNKIALVFDEIQCGGGRTGTLWHYEHHDVAPDIMTIAKPIGGGLPLGAVICTEAIAKAMTYGEHGTTFGGNPLCCAVGLAMLTTITAPGFLQSVLDKGAYLTGKLRKFADQCGCIADITGTGLMIGVKITIDPLAVVAACREKGLLLIKAENSFVRFLPPLIITLRQIDDAVKIFSAVICNLENKKK